MRLRLLSQLFAVAALAAAPAVRGDAPPPLNKDKTSTTAPAAGWESARVSEAKQAAWYGGLLDDWFTGRGGRDWIDRVFFYEMRDGSAAGSPSWGILRPDGSRKAAYEAYRRFIADHKEGARD